MSNGISEPTFLKLTILPIRLIWMNEHQPSEPRPDENRTNRHKRNDVEGSSNMTEGFKGDGSTTAIPLNTVGMGRSYEPRIGELRSAHYPFGQYSSYASMTRFMRTLEVCTHKFVKDLDSRQCFLVLLSSPRATHPVGQDSRRSIYRRC